LEFDLGGYVYKTVIECKDYASTITVEKIDAFIGKTNDIPGLSLFMRRRQVTRVDQNKS
jgi:hypothetical protein